MAGQLLAVLQIEANQVMMALQMVAVTTMQVVAVNEAWHDSMTNCDRTCSMPYSTS